MFFGASFSGLPNHHVFGKINYFPYENHWLLISARGSLPRYETLLQTRTKTINGELAAMFQRWFPALAANDSEEREPAAAAA
jgi:hypothetical protein